MNHPDGLNNTLLSPGRGLKLAPAVGKVGRRYKGRERAEGPLIARAVLGSSQGHGLLMTSSNNLE